MSLTTLNEQYYFLEGADESLILLNPVLKNQNLQFVKFTFAEFEEKFWRFFLHDAKHRKHGTETYKKGEIVVYENISSVFFKTITKNNLLSVASLFLKGYIIFLKNNNADGIYQLDMDELLNSLYNDEGEDKNKGDGNILQLIYKLRLFKKGHIRFISSLFIGKDKEFYFDNEYNTPLKFFWDNRYKIDEADLVFLDSHLNEPLIIPPLLDLAFISFNQIYELQSEKLSFVVLIMALESIYNRSGQDPIQHIISRHVSLTLSNSKEEFETLFRKVKDFYNLRSIIVHGSTEKKELIKIENIHDKLEELFDLVRAILKKLIWLYDFEISQPTKNSLFDYLNSKGFTR